MYWIIDREAHRDAWRADAPEDGSVVDSVFGPAKVILGADPGDVWLCDLCNADMSNGVSLVPAQGSSAYCWDCAEKIGMPPEALCKCEGCWGVIMAMASMAMVTPEEMARSLIVYLGTKGRELWDTNSTETTTD